MLSTIGSEVCWFTKDPMELLNIGQRYENPSELTEKFSSGSSIPCTPFSPNKYFYFLSSILNKVIESGGQKVRTGTHL